jgi:hypothetical protein
MSHVERMIAYDNDLVAADHDACDVLLERLRQCYGEQGRPDIPPKLSLTPHGLGRLPWRPRVAG